MGFSESFFASRFGITRGGLESYLGEALSQGGDYADLYFEYLSTSHISIDESIVKSAVQGVSLGVGVRVIAGERTGYAYSDGTRQSGKDRTRRGKKAKSVPGSAIPSRNRFRRACGAGEARRRCRACL